MNASEILKETAKILEFIRLAYLEVYPNYLRYYPKIESFELDNNNFCFYGVEYNESCHCHPEYTHESFSLPIEIADSMNRDTIVSYLKKEKVECEAKYKREKEEREKKERQYTENQERKELERLMKKYKK